MALSLFDVSTLCLIPITSENRVDG